MLKNVCPSCSNGFWNPVHKKVEGMRGWRLSRRMPHCPHCGAVLQLTKAAKQYQIGWLLVFVVLLNLVVTDFNTITPHLSALLAATLAANLWAHHRLTMYELAG